MNVRTILTSVSAACVFGSPLFSAPTAQAFQLITQAEAALPAASGGHERGISRGPTIVIVSPPPAAGTIHSPLDLNIRFVTHGGTGVDVNSVLVTYMKQPAVDLTQRIRSFIGITGIDVKDAEVPPGKHRLRINVADTNGHEGSADVTFTVSR